MSDPALYAIIGEFAEPEGAAAAARQLRDTGFSRLDAYSPYPVADLEEAIHPRPSFTIPAITVCGGLLGAAVGYYLQYYAAAISYPLNVGGRPLNSWPAFAVSAFEIILLFALTGAFLAFLAVSRLPLFYHPVFAVDGFGHASQDRFFLCIEAKDPRFHSERIRAILARHGATHIAELPA